MSGRYMPPGASSAYDPYTLGGTYGTRVMHVDRTGGNALQRVSGLPYRPEVHGRVHEEKPEAAREVHVTCFEPIKPTPKAESIPFDTTNESTTLSPESRAKLIAKAIIVREEMEAKIRLLRQENQIFKALLHIWQTATTHRFPKYLPFVLYGVCMYR